LRRSSNSSNKYLKDKLEAVSCCNRLIGGIVGFPIILHRHGNISVKTPISPFIASMIAFLVSRVVCGPCWIILLVYSFKAVLIAKSGAAC